MGFAENLKNLLDEKEMKAVDLARSAGLSEAAISDYLKGKKEPRGKQSIEIARALHITLDELWETKFANNSMQMEWTEKRKSLVWKYESLDEHGKEMVDSALEIEYKRVQQAQEAAESDDDNIVDMMQFLTPVSAGTGEIIYSTSEVGNLSVASNSYTRKADFCVTVKGNSMEPRFCDGDIVLVQEREDIEYGDIGIFILGGQSYIKQKGEGKLISLNKNIPDVILGPYDEVICQGKVIGVLDPDWIVK